MNSKIFKTVTLGGLDKKDVLTYIKQIETDNKLQKKKDTKILDEITLKLESVNSEKKNIEEELINLKSENIKILNENNKVVEEAKMFKDKYDDITKILLDIESKKRIVLEEAKNEGETILLKATIEAEKNINNTKELSKKILSESESKYKQTVKATLELSQIIEDSRNIFNKISDETLELIGNPRECK